MLRAIAVLAATAAVASASPGSATSDALRDGNTAAMAGDWQRVAQLVDPLLQRDLAPADLGEAHRLAGIAAFFQQRSSVAERHFLAYLRIEIDGRLDSALYPPEVVTFFNDVASRHAAELRALRTPRFWLLNLIPPAGQFQNGDRTKAYVIGGVLGAFLIVNLWTYSRLRAWCEHTDGTVGGGLTCTDGENRNEAAAKLRPYNIASGIGVILTYAYGVYDGVQGYRRGSRERSVQPFVAIATGSHVFGVSGSF